MKRKIPVVLNPTTLLNPSEVQKLSEYIPNKCLCTPKVLTQLELIFVQDFGNTGWQGLWIPVTEKVDGNDTFSGGIIVLNTYGLGSEDNRLECLTEALCHEYGHHWTLSYAYGRVEDPLSTRFILTWYNCRNVSRNILHYRLPVENYDDWLHCDKEVIAEDFKNNFTPYSKGHYHKMEQVAGIGLPSPAAVEYLSKFHHLTT